MKARDIMTSPVISVLPDTPVRDIAGLLSERRISGVPVLEGERLVGLVSEADLLRRRQLGGRALFLGIDLPPVMHYAVVDHYVGLTATPPGLSFQPGEQLAADRFVVLRMGRFRQGFQRQGLHEIGPGDDADHPPRLQHRNPLDPALLQNRRDFLNRRIRGDRFHLLRHDVARAARAAAQLPPA